MPYPCEEEAPKDPNVYTDGSLRRPCLHQFSLGGFGILHKNRTAEGLLHHNELHLAYSKQEGSDLHLCAPLPGPMCSSTRTETAGMLLAICCPGPVHIASDSKSAVLTLQSIIGGKPRKKPWNLYPNGDLWQVIAQFVPIKGASSIAVKWVKGHTDSIHIAAGIISFEDHLGNSIADQLADDGVDKHPEGLDALGSMYAYRRHVYLHMLYHIHNYIVSVFFMFQARDKSNNKTDSLLGKSTKGVLPIIPNSGDTNCCRQPRPWWPRDGMIPKNSFLFLQIWHFVNSIRITPRRNLDSVTGQCEQGTSWIELFCFFEILGGQIQKDPHETKYSLRKALALFKEVTKTIVRLFLYQEDAILFSPSKSPRCRLRGVGISNFVPCINGLVVVDQIHAKQMLPALVSLSSRVTKNFVRSINDGSALVVPGRLSLKGVPAWRKVLKPCGVLPSGDQIHREPPGCQFQHIQVPREFALKCPHCTTSVVVARTTLYAKGIFKQLVCSSCAIHTTARKWLCACNVGWISCQRHAQTGFACRSVSFKRKQPVQVGLFGSCNKFINTIYTNNIPPPRASDAVGGKRARGVKHVSPNYGAASFSSTSIHVPETHRARTIVSTVGAHPRGVKRAAQDKPSARSRRKPPPTSVTAVAAINRMREAREHPL